VSGPRGATFTETWWGSRWIQALRRLGRGWARSLANARSSTSGIRDLDISPGRIEAVVPGDNGDTYNLRIRLRTLPESTWQRVLRRLTRKALYAAKLLSGEMPRDIERVFAQSRASLFPRRRHEIDVSCTCGYLEHPCAHVAAAQYVLAEAFDRDPFLLFELRGRSREQVLAVLREIRGSRASLDRAGAAALLDEDDDDAPFQPRPEDYALAGDDLAALGFHIAAPDVTVGAIRAIGPPRSWPQPLPMLRAFVPIYRAASALALDIAWSGEEAVPASALLPPAESEESLAAMAASMTRPTMPSYDGRPPQHRPGGKRPGGKRRGPRGRRGPPPGPPGGAPRDQGGKKGRGRRRGGRRPRP
jgi:uncharacterized Zn finger protein